MSRLQKSVLLLAALAGIAMVLFPPKTRQNSNGRRFGVAYSFISEGSRPIEYSLLWTQLAVLGGVAWVASSLGKSRE